ncbi:hypothetical protein L5515_010160 [Caenorhabditis briggsae]|uniref:MRG domain-containing protein n=2 Tax=Caenorhabditis briggsae TaxID=6238 RepID=A0AAE9ESV3_CAEBR|nr:hypothetical protein L5515_010160 [Caenorhabditis briggsae]
MSESSQKFAVGERCVCIWHGDNQPYAAQILSTSDGHYEVHYNGFTPKWDFGIPIGQEDGTLFKGTLEEYAEKYEVEVSDWALQHSRIHDDQSATPMQMDPYGRTYARRIFVEGDDSSGRRRSRRLTLGSPSTSAAFQGSSAKKVKIEKPDDPEEEEEEVHCYPSRRQSQKIPLVQQDQLMPGAEQDGSSRRLRSWKVVVKEEPEDEEQEEEEPRRTYSLRSRTVEPEKDAEESEEEKAEIQESEDDPTRRMYSLRSRAEVKEEVESEESEGSDQEKEEEEPVEPRRSYSLRSRTVEPDADEAVDSEEDELKESDEGDEPEEEELEIPEEEPEAPEEPEDEEEAPRRFYSLRSQTVEPEESEDDATDYEDAEEHVLTDDDDAEEEPELQELEHEPEEPAAPEDPESEESPRRKYPLRTTSNILASPPRQAKRSLVKELQSPAPRRRCPFTRPDNQPHCYPDPSKIGTLAGLFNNRSKIRLPGATYIIEHADRKMQIHAYWCTPIVPAEVPVEEIVNDYMIAQGHIRSNQTATPAQIAQLAPGLSRMIEHFNQNIGNTLTDDEKDKFMEVTAGELPFKIYGVIHLLRLLSKLHESTIPLDSYELIKEESTDFLKFVNVNYKKYYQRDAEYPIDKHGFESRTGILFLERDI